MAGLKACMAGLPVRVDGRGTGRLPPPGGPLPGATANRGRVIRVGGTVRRPTAPCRHATHALLAHLAAAGFDGAPRVLDR